jgi:carbon-monoxide dehydrogenase medium subunit
VKPAPFEYLPAQSLEEALAALQRNGPEGKILAGGQSLLPLLNLRLAKPKVVVDLNRVPGLDAIGERPRCLAIGAMARQSAVERSPLVRDRCPILAEAVSHIGHVAIRHRGTIGGSLVHADPAAELPAVALALDAQFEVAGPGGARVIPAEEFFVDYLTTGVKSDEVLREIVFPVLRPTTGYAVAEITRRHGDFAIAGVVALADLDDSGKISAARIALFGVAPMAVRARQAERALIGQAPDDTVLRDGAALVQDILDPADDVRASSAYRTRAAVILTIRALRKALGLRSARQLS